LVFRDLTRAIIWERFSASNVSVILLKIKALGAGIEDDGWVVHPVIFYVCRGHSGCPLIRMMPAL
jgi:hypothetical protein